MIIQLLSKYNKQIAWFLLAIFYSDLVSAKINNLIQANTISKYRSVEKSNYNTERFVNTISEVSTTRAKQHRQKNSKEVKLSDKKAELPTVENPKEVEEQSPAIGGPGQPEMSSFKSIGADNMVDLFTGNFSYNIPLGDVGGYPINIFYNSGITMEQEASWVGLGWNINPGTIMRNVRGLPDDFNGTDKLTKEMYVKPNITAGVKITHELEIGGTSIKKFKPGANVSTGIFYNNYRGLGLDFGFATSLSIMSKVSGTHSAKDQKVKFKDGVGAQAALNFNLNSQTGINLNPSLGLKLFDDNKKTETGLTASATYNSRIGLQSISLSAEMHKYKVGVVGNMQRGFEIVRGLNQASLLNSGGSLSFSKPSVNPTINMPFTNLNINLGFFPNRETPPFLASKNRFSGYYTRSYIATKDQHQEKSAFGYLYYQNANGNKDAILDFNRLNDVIYTNENPTIAIPNYTYDIYTISGEGTGGSFRPYRGDVGYMRDNYTKTRDHSGSLDIELGGAGQNIKIGVNANFVYTPTVVGEWQSGNIAAPSLAFKKNNRLFQAAYFKNPGEMAIVGDKNFLNRIGNDDLMRLKLGAGSYTTEPPVLPIWEQFNNERKLKTSTPFLTNQLLKKERDKRSQVITYLTAAEAAEVGLDKKINYYTVNKFPNLTCKDPNLISINRSDNNPNDAIRRSHHISEISVLQGDGRRYVYGIPVYNTQQVEASFTVNNDGCQAQQLVKYDPDPDKIGKEGKEGSDDYKSIQKLDPYAHSFLLTGLLSPDYVDVTGDGITADDLGDAVKFNYTKIEKAENKDFGWRAPYTFKENLAAYNEGLKTTDIDQKGNYTYGTKELWYLNSIESKNMIAVFTTSGNRYDGREAKSEKGGVGSDGTYKLEKIDIYTKPAWSKNSTANPAIPIKTIKFEYSYALCPGTPDNKKNTIPDFCNLPSVDDPNNKKEKGKLTLEKIWFTYNGNDKKKKNIYSFKYNATNPTYNRASNDRWGNFKDAASNTDNALDGFGTLNNVDYPYALQNKAKADANAAAWNLDEIGLPSGGTIKVDYESDDYAYVQDRRAAQMFKIAGFVNGGDPNGAIVNTLYNNPTQKDNFYVVINLPAQNRAEIKQKYLEGINQLFFKLAVKMPKDQYGQGFEYIPIYAGIDDADGQGYGPRTDNNSFWIKLAPDVKGYSPLFYNSVEFLKQYLPSKAYKGSSVRDTKGLALLRAILGMYATLYSSLVGYYTSVKLNSWCKEVNLGESFIRLNSPNYAKLGGGLRVKKVVINDNWNQLTTKLGKTPANASLYGQEYDYTTDLVLANGTVQKISSGVATYEPFVGAEENPFREILKYDDKQTWGPSQRGAIEKPLGEMFYPSPSIGYSKVTVSSIHKNNIKSTTGKTVSEFFTARDFPVKSDFTDFDDKSRVRNKSNPILSLLKLDIRDKVTLSQGFRVQTNDMHGKPKKTSIYAANNTLVSSSENTYRITKNGENNYTFNNKVDVVTSGEGKISNETIGKEIEVMTDVREHNAKAITFNLEFNLDINGAGPVFMPLFTILPPVYFAEDQFRSVSVLKIVNNFGILESVKTIDKGSEVNAKNLVYDAETGNVILSATTNAFDKPIYSYNYPSHWAYKGMQGAYQNIDFVLDNVRFQNGKLTTAGFDFKKYIESGDEIFVTDQSIKGAPEEPGCYTGCVGPFIPKPQEEGSVNYVRKIWAIDMRKDPSFTTTAPNNQEKDNYIFVDKNGNPYSGGKVSMRIIRSGKRNLMNASVGAFSSLKNPVEENTTTLTKSIEVKDNTEVINTSTATYKEKWRGENLFYAVPSGPTVVKYPKVKTLTLLPTENHITKKFSNGTGVDNTPFYQNIDNANTFTSSIKQNEIYPDNSGNVGTAQVKTWMRFNFDQIPDNSIISKANLVLLAHTYHPEEHTSNIVGHSSFNTHERSYINQSSFDILSFGEMNVNWPQNEQGWNNIFGSIGTSPVKHNFNWLGQLTSNTSIEVPIKQLAQRMLDNKNFNTPAITFSQFNSRLLQNDQTRFCFTKSCTPSAEGVSIAPNPNSLNECTRLKLEYYNCNDVYADGETIPAGNPTCIVPNTEAFNCISVFDKSLVNPYTKGILGNWRADKTYAYYGERRETKINDKNPINKAGIIQNYTPFWEYNATNQLLTISPTATTSAVNTPAWNWTSEVTQFNAKGFELENKDPLGRFNTGIYGYNQGLPIAVANNSKLRESTFDGFEDYGFETSNCIVPCQPKTHHTISTINTILSDTYSHTGLYSAKLSPSQSFFINAPLVDNNVTDNDFDINFKNKTGETYTGEWVFGQGDGLLGSYHNIADGFSILSLQDWAIQVKNILDPNVDPLQQIDAQVNLNESPVNLFSGAIPPSGIGSSSNPNFAKNNSYCVRWDGYLQAPCNGTLDLEFTADDCMEVRFDLNSDGWAGADELISPTDFFTHHEEASFVYTTPNLEIGKLYKIRIYFYEKGGESKSIFRWKVPGSTNFELVPQEYLYTKNAEKPGLITGTFECKKLEEIKLVGNGLIDKFSPLQNKKMLVSAWLKVENGDCKNGAYTGNTANIYYDNNATASFSFLPSGNIIDGWQRFEGEFLIPSTATNIRVSFNNNSQNTSYWDDIRIHPYNANMKSFVYNKNNLRLMAELDENNYASFYEYDDDGTLVRVKKETTDGIKTITETRSALQKTINIKID